MKTSQPWEAKRAMRVRIDLFGGSSHSSVILEAMRWASRHNRCLMWSTALGRPWCTSTRKSRALEFPASLLFWRYMSVMCGLSSACELGARPHLKRSAVQADWAKASPSLWRSARKPVDSVVIIYAHCDGFGFHMWNSMTSLNESWKIWDAFIGFAKKYAVSDNTCQMSWNRC